MMPFKCTRCGDWHSDEDFQSPPCAKINRRNILAVLGLAAVSTPALAAEQIDTLEMPYQGVPGVAMRSPEAQERFAAALEKAAAAVRSGELTCHQMDIASSVKLNEWIEHKVTFSFELVIPKSIV